ncbi:MAG: hypothetical protein PVJ86_07300 [Phycisphaerales bacterium]|jgi:hypothetical protein
MNRNTKTNRILTYALVAAGVLQIAARSVKADFVFGTPENLGPAINSPMHDCDPGLSWDGLSLCFVRLPLDGSGDPEQWVAQRATPYDAWGDPVSLGPWVGSAAGTVTLFNAVVEAMGGGVPGWDPVDDLEAYFAHSQLGGYGGIDLFVLKRETVDADFGPPENLGPNVNTPNNEIRGTISPDGLTLYFSSFGRPEGYGRSDLYVTTRATRSDPWGIATNLGPTVNSPSWDIWPIMSPDGLWLFFTSGRPDGLGEADIWMTRRASPSDPWGQAVNLGPTVNTSADDQSPHISRDGSTLYFESKRPDGYGGVDLYQVPILPIVDFNGDGKVNRLDAGLLMVNWGTDNSLYDIGPTAFGDGIVDSKDLMVLAENGAMLCGDVNYDGVVDFFDLAEVAKNWLQDNNP